MLDERGQSIQVGAVLVFAALILLLSLYQAVVVPQQNKQVEFDHSQRVQGELLDLRNAVVSTLGDSARRSVSVQLGTRYPPRILAVNPPPASGQLRTAGTADGAVAVGLTNATALGRETADFWNGTRRDYSTGGVVYRPSYSEYGQPPSTHYENSVLYDEFRFEEATIARSDQALVDGDRITLVALNGSVSRSSSGTTTVDVRPVSASSTTIAVRNESADSPVTLRVPTRLSERKWEELLADEFVAEGGNVTDVRTNPVPGEYRMLVVELVPGTYDLQLAKAGVGTRVTGTEPAYLTDVSGNGSTVPEGGSQQFVVEVRDRYNNPVSGVAVRANASWSTAASTGRSGEDGRVAFVSDVPEDIAGPALDARVNVSLGRVAPSERFDGTTAENVSLNVTVYDTDGGASGGGGGAGGAYATVWENPEAQPGVSCNTAGTNCTLDASQTTTFDATAATVPTAENTTMSFSVNDSSVAEPSPWGTLTGGDGRASTTITAASNGDVKLYAASGGSGDVINLTVENFGVASNPPDVTIDSTAVSSIGPAPNGKSSVTVEFTGSDPDGDITGYTVTLYDSSAQTTQLNQTSDSSYTGGQTTVSIDDRQADTGSTPYYVVVEVVDSNGNVATDGRST